MLRPFPVLLHAFVIIIIIIVIVTIIIIIMTITTIIIADPQKISHSSPARLVPPGETVYLYTGQTPLWAKAFLPPM